MGIFDRVERRIERTVNGVFARAFKTEVEPVEIASAIRKAMDDRAVTPSRGHVLVPNVFTVLLSETDFERLSEFEEDVLDELVVATEEHVDSQRYSPAGPISVTLERTSDLETGVFRIRPSKAKQTSQHKHSEPAQAHRMPQPQHDEPAPSPYARPAQDSPAARRGDGSPGYDEDDPALAAFNPYGVNPYDENPHHEPYPDALAQQPQQSQQQQRRSGPERPRPVAAARRARPGDRPYLASREDRFLLMGPINVIGREDDSDIVFDDPGISRRHSEIRVTTDGPHLNATVRDLGSTNGTFVNGERVSSQRLSDGDQITFGRTTVVFHAGRS